MFVHVWRMRARKKRAKEYEKFGLQVTLSSLKKINGCVDAFFLKIFESQKPQYLWVVFWKDREALEAARSNPVWREQIRKFEAGKFYKTPPLQLICERLGSLGTLESVKTAKTKERGKSRRVRNRAATDDAAEDREIPPVESAQSADIQADPTIEGEEAAQPN